MGAFQSRAPWEDSPRSEYWDSPRSETWEASPRSFEEAPRFAVTTYDDYIAINESNIIKDKTVLRAEITSVIQDVVDKGYNICKIEDHNTDCHFDASISNECYACRRTIVRNRELRERELRGCLLVYTTAGTSDRCNKVHFVFCHTCIFLGLPLYSSLYDFYGNYCKTHVQRETNKGKTFVDMIAEKINSGWMISQIANHHECADKIFCVKTRCLLCFMEYSSAPRNGYLIHQRRKCNYTEQHFFYCATCMNKLYPFFYNYVVHDHFKTVLSPSLAQNLVEYL